MLPLKSASVPAAWLLVAAAWSAAIGCRADVAPTTLERPAAAESATVVGEVAAVDAPAAPQRDAPENGAAQAGATEPDATEPDATESDAKGTDEPPATDGADPAERAEGKYPPPAAETPPGDAPPGDPPADAPPPLPDPPGAKRLDPESRVWVDRERNTVFVDGEVCLREGQLEMFACPRGTKEHESIISVAAKPFHVHAGLLAVGADSGTPVQFDPEYRPATGSVIEIRLQWIDEEGKRQEVPAQEWIRDTANGKPMTHDWVFVGSGFWTDETTGQKHYMADGGDFICVSNFPSATLDLPVESTQLNKGLLFEAFTENIPPLKTPVRMLLVPRPEKPGDSEKDESPKDESDEGESQPGESQPARPETGEAPPDAPPAAQDK